MTRLHTPTSVGEAVAALAADPDLVPVAGCTDLMVGDLEDNLTLPGVVDLSGIAELSEIRTGNGGIEIGSGTTFSRIRKSPELQKEFPALTAAAAEIGGWQIQNRATIGGNVANASPAGDSLPVLLSLNAVLDLVGPEGNRLVDYSDFHTGYRQTALKPGEIISAIHLPAAPAGARQFFRKVGTRQAQAISKVVVAMLAVVTTGTLAEIRIAAGSVAAIPIRLRRAEAALVGQPINSELAAQAADLVRAEVEPIDDVRSTATYRSEVLGRVVRRFILQL